MKFVEVAIGIIYRETEAGTELLITRRPAENVLGGYWEFPGGKMEAGEAAHDCIEREVMEEVNLRVKVGSRVMIIEHQYEHAHVRLHCHRCDFIEGQLQCLEVEEALWIKPSELGGFKFPAANRALIDLLRQL